MSTPTALRLRDARDRIIDLLGLGQTNPLRDLPVPDDRLTVPFGSVAKVSVEVSQPGVIYSLRDKDGHPAGVEIAGTGDTVLIETPPISDDVTYTVHARKSTGREADLFMLAPVKVGLDLELAAGITPADGAERRLVDFGTAVRVRIAQSQDGVDYRLVQFPAGDPPHPDDMQAAAGDDVLSDDNKTVRGTGGSIDLPSKPMAEDTVLRIRAIKTFDPTLGRSPQTNILTVRLPLLVRADPGRPLSADKAIVAYQEAGSVRVGKTQASAFYRAFVRPVADPEYQQGAAPAAGLIAVKVDGEPDVPVLAPSVSTSDVDDPPAFVPAGDEQLGTAADLALALPPATADILVVVRARKHHQSAGGPVISAVSLGQAVVVLTRPNPNAAPSVLVTLQTDKTTGTLEVIGGQPGVFYTPTVVPPGTPILPPAYVHKRDAADPSLNKGLGQLKLEVDFALARDQLEAGWSDPARTPPPPPLLATDPLAAGATLNLHAMNAQTRVGADLAAPAVIDPMPELHVDAVVDFGVQARVEVRASRASDSYTLLRDGVVVGAAQDGTGATLALLSDPLRQDAVLEISAVSKAAIPVDRRARLPVAVRPDSSLPVRAKDVAVPKGRDTAILVDRSQPSIAYQLVAGATPVGKPVMGSGATIALPTGALSADTTFSVSATRADIAEVTVTLAQTAAVAVKPP